jgi:hypothetical protein
MGRAAGEEAAGGQVRYAGDLATMERVRTALLRHLGGTMPEAPPPQIGPSGYMDRRTVTPLHQAGSL